MKITYIGHSTILIKDKEFNILTDPFFSPSFSGFRRQVLPSMHVEDLPRIDLILISHTHPDHCDYGALQKLSKPSRVIMPQGTSLKVQKMGFNVEELDNWESTTIGAYHITAVPAKHQGKCVGYVIEGSKIIYFAGDTFYTELMTELSKKYELDVAFLPIGGNRFFGRKMVMDPQDAARATEELKSEIVIPIHFGTFGRIPLMFSMNGEPDDFVGHIRKDGIRASVKVLGIGECLNVGPTGTRRKMV